MITKFLAHARLDFLTALSMHTDRKREAEMQGYQLLHDLVASPRL